MDFTPLQHFMDDLCSWRMPGNSAIVYKDGRQVFSYQSGYADLAAQRPMQGGVLCGSVVPFAGTGYRNKTDDGKKLASACGKFSDQRCGKRIEQIFCRAGGKRQCSAVFLFYLRDQFHAVFGTACAVHHPKGAEKRKGTGWASCWKAKSIWALPFSKMF